MSQLFSIQDDKVVITKLELETTKGSVKHDGSIAVSGNAEIKGSTTVEKDLTVRGSLTVDVIHANQIINNNISNGVKEGSTKFTGTNEAELNGQGIAWSTFNSEKQLIYRTGNRLWTNMNIDLSTGSCFKIDDIEVLTSNTLGSGITRSSLRRLAPLDSLKVDGNTNLGDLVIVDSDIMRVGIGTESPNAALSIVDQNIELVLGASTTGSANIGVYTYNDLTLSTDNQARVTIKSGGDVHFGSATNHKTNVYIHGTIYADAVITDNKEERTSSIEFKSNGQGLVWSGQGSPKQFILREDPYRLWSTEHLELSQSKGLWINGHEVLTESTLGTSVTSSSLTSLGKLNSLTVEGTTQLGQLHAHGAHIENLVADDIYTGSIRQASKIQLSIGDSEVFSADNNSIQLGNSANTGKTLKLFGNVTVNINNPEPDVNLSVAGNIAFAGRKFLTGSAAPVGGNFKAGDVCWNENPNQGGYVGWVCVQAGSPGQWAPFGLIA